MANRGKKESTPWEIYDRIIVAPQTRKLEDRLLGGISVFELILAQHFEILLLRSKLSELKLAYDLERHRRMEADDELD